MSTIYSTGSAWKSFAAIRRLVIFGASYCSVEHILTHDASKPNVADPLGIPFPGSEEIGLWNEFGEPNWVGHLITKYRPGPRYAPPKEPFQPGRLEDQSPAWIEHPLLVNNYARGGDTVDGVARQIQKVYLPQLGKDSITLPWTAEDALFITFVGINDCAYSVNFDSIKRLFDLQDEVYKTGARNFVFFDLPPIQRSPAVAKHQEFEAARRYQQWNLYLREAAEKFGSTHVDSSVFIFSTFDVFNTLLDDPVAFGFEEADLKRAGGSIWYDHLHPTSKVHQLVASHLANFLSGIPAKATFESTLESGKSTSN